MLVFLNYAKNYASTIYQSLVHLGWWTGNIHFLTTILTGYRWKGPVRILRWMNCGQKVNPMPVKPAHSNKLVMGSELVIPPGPSAFDQVSQSEYPWEILLSHVRLFHSKKCHSSCVQLTDMDHSTNCPYTNDGCSLQLAL